MTEDYIYNVIANKFQQLLIANQVCNVLVNVTLSYPQSREKPLANIMHVSQPVCGAVNLFMSDHAAVRNTNTGVSNCNIQNSKVHNSISSIMHEKLDIYIYI